MVKISMRIKEWAVIQHHSQLDADLLHAYYVHHAYPRHSHDYYVISLIQQGHQSFTHRGTKHITPPGGLILINPGAVHTGEAAEKSGFELRSLYPTLSHMERALFELTGRHRPMSFFAQVRVDHPWLSRSVLLLHKAMMQDSPPLETESRFLWVLTELIKQYAETPVAEQKLGQEKKAVQRVRQYIDENFSQSIRLDQLAQLVALSPFYLLRAFRAEIGMPPHAYLESVRIQHTQRLLTTERSLVEIAAETGFSSQSHMTRSFRKIIGVTPGQYARQLRIR